MSASSVLLIAATIIAVDGGGARIETGSESLLEPGDFGQAFYELVVNGEPKRIEVGSVLVASVAEGRVTLSTEPGRALRPGYQVEFRVPVDRRSNPLPPRPPVSLPPTKRPPEPVARDQPSPPVQPAPAPEEPSTQPSEPPLPPRGVIEILAGSYFIGLDRKDAGFFNQIPRHTVFLEAFAVDRSVVTTVDGSALTGLTFVEAELHCQELGLGLPSEAQWEIAAQTPGFIGEPDLLEWTASWYEAYPGNRRVEEAYGRTHRVLRGLGGGSLTDVQTRRFMRPDRSHPSVGFRCVGSLD